jgi:smad nuclear-interacting protein 1
MGESTTKVIQCKPYLMDLESTNGTFINGQRIEDARYYELHKGDVLKFGDCSQEYVLMSE